MLTQYIETCNISPSISLTASLARSLKGTAVGHHETSRRADTVQMMIKYSIGMHHTYNRL